MACDTVVMTTEDESKQRTRARLCVSVCVLIARWDGAGADAATPPTPHPISTSRRDELIRRNEMPPDRWVAEYIDVCLDHLP